jgi:hypothetical protein
MNLACDLTGTSDIRCFAHTRDLCFRHSCKIPKVITLLDKIKRIVGFIHKSPCAQSELEKAQSKLDLKLLKLKQSV